MLDILLAVAIFWGIAGIGMLVYAWASDYGYRCGREDAQKAWEAVVFENVD